MSRTSTSYKKSIPSLIERTLHTRIEEVRDDFDLTLQASTDANIILIVGPTGAGKTTLGKYLVEAELKNQQASMTLDPGFIPAIYAPAKATGQKIFSWPLMYRRLLNQLPDPIDVPRTFYRVDPQAKRVERQYGPNLNTTAGLREAVENSLQHRNTRFVVIDEVAFMLKGCNLDQLENQLNTLRSLSNDSGVVWVLMGSYDLFEVLTLSDQLCRRMNVIHFSRYKKDVAADYQAFRMCIRKFATFLPALRDVDLLAYSDIFYDATVGCIGTLSTTLNKLHFGVQARGWSMKTLRWSLPTELQIKKILGSTLNGEERIAPGLATHLLCDEEPTIKKKVA